MMEILWILCGASLFAAGAYLGWRAAYARQDTPAPSVLLDAPRGHVKVLDAYPEAEDE